MGAFSCLCLPLPKRTPDVNGELELKSACEKVAAPKSVRDTERPLSYADLCGISKGIALSPFETALSARGASAPRLSFQGTTPAPFLSPFDSVKSFPSFLSAASYPSDLGEHAAPAPLPAIRTSAVSPLELALGHFDLDRRDTAHDLSSSQPPSPKTPHKGESFSKGASRHGDSRRLGCEAAHYSNPIRGHPRYRKLKQLMSRCRSRSDQNSQGSRPLLLLCKDEDMGQMTVITFLQRGSPQIQACEADIMTMRTCNAHPFIMHLHQAFVTREHLAVVTEHGPGGVLSDYVEEHSSDVAGVGIQEDIARSFFQQLMVAVDFCHAMGIPIQDLRPHNMLLLEHNDEPSLCSFAGHGDSCIRPEGGLGMDGVPRLKLMLTQMQYGHSDAASGDSAAALFSRADYAAPEVNAGSSGDAEAADVWSCGVLLHYMLTGDLPFHPRIRRGQMAMYNPESPVQADRHRYLKLKGLSPGCRDLLTKMFRANPKDRATVSNIMSHTWFRTDCPQGMADVNTELIIMIEEGLVESFSTQGEDELRSTLKRASQIRVPSQNVTIRINDASGSGHEIPERYSIDR